MAQPTQGFTCIYKTILLLQKDSKDSGYTPSDLLSLGFVPLGSASTAQSFDSRLAMRSVRSR